MSCSRVVAAGATLRFQRHDPRAGFTCRCTGDRSHRSRHLAADAACFGRAGHRRGENRSAAAPAGEPTAPGPTADATNVAELYAQFRREFEARNYPEAAALGQKVLALTEQSAKSPTDEDVQVALINLGLAQYFAGDYSAAETTLLRVIDAIEKSGRPLTTRLARANAGLATTYYANKRYDLAVERFEQAIGMSRRHEGLLNTYQVPLLEKYADSLTQIGRLDDALQAHKYLLRVETRTYGENDPRLAPALERLGRWYSRVSAYDQSRRTLKRAIDIVVNAEGENSPRLIGPLAALAECDRRQLYDPSSVRASSPDNERSTMFHDEGMMTPPQASAGMLISEAEKALKRAVNLAETRKEPSFLQIADVRTQLGDWFQTRGLPEQALPNYLKAWQAASKTTERMAGKTLTELLFGKPVLLHFVRPEGSDRYAGRKPDEIETKLVTLSLTVDAQGEPQAIKLTDDSGDARRAQRTLQSLQNARYRPRFEEGKPVATPGIVFSLPWTLPIEQPAESAPAKSASNDTTSS